MSSTESTATPAIPTSPTARGLSESYLGGRRGGKRGGRRGGRRGREEGEGRRRVSLLLLSKHGVKIGRNEEKEMRRKQWRKGRREE